jgi:hypothetical protein
VSTQLIEVSKQIRLKDIEVLHADGDKRADIVRLQDGKAGKNICVCIPVLCLLTKQFLISLRSQLPPSREDRDTSTLVRANHCNRQLA